WPAVHRVIDLVIDPAIVPAPALELRRAPVLRPADFVRCEIDELVLPLSAHAWPERRVADDEIERIDGGGGGRGNGSVVGAAAQDGDREDCDRGARARHRGTRSPSTMSRASSL